MGRQEQTNHLFSNRDLRILLVPLIVEQILNSLMGTADSIMVSNVGSAAISAVSLVDSINILVIQAFYALAAGGTIVCSQYIGQKDKKNDEKEKAKGTGKVVFLLSPWLFRNDFPYKVRRAPAISDKCLSLHFFVHFLLTITLYCMNSNF